MTMRYLNTLRIYERGNMTDLENMGMVRIPGGPVQMGTNKALVCRLEGRRWNETPVRQIEVSPFWLAICKVTNQEFERFNPTHVRPPQSAGDRMPVTDVMYGEALSYIKKLNRETGANFRLTTEPEWIFAAALLGWEYSYQPQAENPRSDIVHVFRPDRIHGAVEVDDPRFPTNRYGIHQLDHNVSEYMAGHYRTTEGQYGAQDDGMYCIAKGGNWGHCSYGPGVQRRLLVDVSDRNPRIGFRLAHSV